MAAQTRNDEKKPQNIYDDAVFFEGYRKLRQNDTGLNGALEVPAMRALLPDLSNSNVLDIGCGFGDFARFARQAGAVSVLALDVSAKMLEEALRLGSDPGITYRHTAIEDATFEPETFELVVSSMALHYVEDYAAVIQRIHAALKPGGRLVFSVEHPICTANPADWVRSAQGEAMHWPLDRYQEEGLRSTSWFVDGVTKFHRTTATYINTLLAAGFQLLHLGEPRPQEQALKERPALLVAHRRPPVLLIAARKLNRIDRA